MYLNATEYVTIKKIKKKKDEDGKKFSKRFFPFIFVSQQKQKKKLYFFKQNLQLFEFKKKKVCFGNVDNNKFISMIIPNSYKYCKTKTIKKECLKKKK